MPSASEHSQILRSIAIQNGFLAVRFAKAEQMDTEARRLENWLNRGAHGTMSYMDNHFELRTDPTKLFHGAKTVISLAYNYYPDEEIFAADEPRISKYAYGKDYHKVVKKKLKQIILQAQEVLGLFAARGFVDSAPILERDWARRSGLGWIGKNTMLINPKLGSFFFLAEIICDVVCDYDDPIQDYCGTCRKCIDACPTDAISENGYDMDGSKCISYLTIERRDAIPSEYTDKMKNWIFGCDICQDVCPWNRFSSPHSEPKFRPKEKLKNMSDSDWHELSEDVFDRLFEGTALRRTKFEGLKRNIDFIKENQP